MFAFFATIRRSKIFGFNLCWEKIACSREDLSSGSRILNLRGANRVIGKFREVIDLARCVGYRVAETCSVVTFWVPVVLSDALVGSERAAISDSEAPIGLTDMLIIVQFLLLNEICYCKLWFGSRRTMWTRFIPLGDDFA